MWDRECIDAVRLSSIAIPDLKASFRPKTSPDPPTPPEPDGWNLGSIIAVILTGIGAAAMHWPLIVAAVPGVLLQGWKFFRETPDTHTVAELQQTIRDLVTDKQRFLKERANDQMRCDLTVLLEAEVISLQKQCLQEVLGGLDRRLVQAVILQLLDLRRQLGQIAGDELRWDDLEVRPLRMTTDREGAALFVRLISSASNRLDLLLPVVDASLVPLLSILRRGVRVRVVTTGDTNSRALLWPLETWDGEWAASIVQRFNGTTVELRQTLLIIDGNAFSTSRRLSDIGITTVVFEDYPDGSLAAQRFFAEMWEGKSSVFGSMTCTQYSQANRSNQPRIGDGLTR